MNRFLKKNWSSRRNLHCCVIAFTLVRHLLFCASFSPALAFSGILSDFLVGVVFDALGAKSMLQMRCSMHTYLRQHELAMYRKRSPKHTYSRTIADMQYVGVCMCADYVAQLFSNFHFIFICIVRRFIFCLEAFRLFADRLPFCENR